MRSPTGDPSAGVAGKIVADELAPRPVGGGKEGAASSTPPRRCNASARSRSRSGRSTIPKYLDVLLHDNTGAIRKPLLAVFPDDRHAQLVVRMLGNQSIKDEGAAADFVQAAVERDLHFANAQITTTGASELLKNLNDYLTGGMATLAAIAIVVMTLILLLLFNVRWRLLPLGVVIVGVIWAFGIAGYIGIPLTIVTIAGLPVMLGIGIDYAIQMHAPRRGGGRDRPAARTRSRRRPGTSARRCSSSPSTPCSRSPRCTSPASRCCANSGSCSRSASSPSA